MKQKSIPLILIILLGIGILYSRKSSSGCIVPQRYQSLPEFDEQELQQFDGVKNESIYIGYHCLIYDVTEGKEEYYGPGKGYHYLVGRDSTKQLELFGGDIIESKYPIVGKLTL